MKSDRILRNVTDFLERGWSSGLRRARTPTQARRPRPQLHLLELRDPLRVADLGHVDAAFMVHADAVARSQRPMPGPSLSAAADDDVDSGISTIRDKKALILVPTYLRSGKWNSIADRPSRETVPQAVIALLKATAPRVSQAVGRPREGKQCPSATA